METPLFAKEDWNTVANIFPHQNSNKFMRMHKSFQQIESCWYEDISKEVNNSLNAFRPTTFKERGQEFLCNYGNERPWKFFVHAETDKILTTNLIGTSDRFGETALHCCVREGLVKLAKV